ncbi:nucleotidyltransferase domain-containing protein [Candidatus Uhrbacteria bacterium]|nr:nucleotidyltransferase domain-containing protein [Candidatus Uhrbacteria bacterium]
MATTSAARRNSRDLDPTIRAIADKIAREYQPERIILFGSHAWGTPGPDSDIDLFIVKKSTESPFDRIRTIKRMLYGSGVATDVLVYTPEQTERRRAIGDPFIRQILERGRTLYAR